MAAMVLRRRDFLALSGAAALACKRKGPTYEATLAGPDVALGHRLRTGDVPVPEHFEEVPLLIVGGGMAGLGAGWHLERCGFRDFLILELESRPGGTAAWGSNGVSAFPFGAHYVPAPTAANVPLVKLLQEVGAVEGVDAKGEPVFSEAVLVRAPEERIFASGAWWEGLYFHPGASPEDERQLKAFFEEVDRWVAFRDAKGRPAFTLPRRGCSDAPECRALDAIGFGAWCDQKGFTSPRLRWFLDYACRDDYGLRLGDTSAWAGLFYFAARKQGKGESSRPVLTWPAGNGFLARHLASVAGSRLRTGVAVARVGTTDRGVEVHALDAATGQPLGYRAQRLIWAGPHHVALRVIEGLAQERGEPLARLRHSPWLVVNLTLRGRPKETGFPLAWDNVLRDSPSLGYVVATHQRGVDHGPTVWTWYHPFTGDPKVDRARLLAMDARACGEMAIQDLERAHPGFRDLVARVDVLRWGHAMIRPEVGLCWDPALETARRPFGPIHFAHTELSGLALLEEALDHGIRAAEEAAPGGSRPGLRRPILG